MSFSKGPVYEILDRCMFSEAEVEANQNNVSHVSDEEYRYLVVYSKQIASQVLEESVMTLHEHDGEFFLLLRNHQEGAAFNPIAPAEKIRRVVDAMAAEPQRSEDLPN